MVSNTDDHVPVSIYPNPITIPAFKTESVSVSFKATEVGVYNSVLVAEIGYIQPDGTVSHIPSTVFDPFNGSDSTPNPDTTTSALSHATKNITKQPKTVRLQVQARAIQPKLGVEEGEDETISLQRILQGDNVRKIKERRGQVSTIMKIILRNCTDATCSFWISVTSASGIVQIFKPGDLAHSASSFKSKHISKSSIKSKIMEGDQDAIRNLSILSKSNIIVDEVTELTPTGTISIPLIYDESKNPNRAKDNDDDVMQDTEGVVAGEIVVNFTNGSKQIIPIYY